MIAIPSLDVRVGDCREILRDLPADSVQCCVTSPPYWGLRDYGHAGQIGQETTSQQFVETMVEVFAEVRRVLKPDGVLWLNLGDTFNAYNGGAGPSSSISAGTQTRERPQLESGFGLRDKSLKPKDMIGIPWRVALALQADGWWLRSDIIWNKPNPMPESVNDRPTKAHEYIFLMAKSDRYYYDADAIKEPVTGGAHSRTAQKTPDGWDTSQGEGAHGAFHKNGREKGKRPPGVTPKSCKPRSGVKANDSFQAALVGLVNSRNKRSVWTVPTAPCKEAHFATYPPDLIKPCILAGSKPGDIVLDPFGGSGTTGEVALELGRSAILIELNPNYAKIIGKRTTITPGLPLS